jgi:hypothetical protein
VQDQRDIGRDELGYDRHLGDDYNKDNKDMHFLWGLVEVVNDFECYDAPMKKATKG